MIFCCYAHENVDILQAYSPAFLRCCQCFRKFLPFLYSLAWPPLGISCCCCLALFVWAYLGPRHTWHLFHYILKEAEKYFEMHQAILLRVNVNIYNTKDNTIEKRGHTPNSSGAWCYDSTLSTQWMHNCVFTKGWATCGDVNYACHSWCLIRIVTLWQFCVKKGNLYSSNEFIYPQ